MVNLFLDCAGGHEAEDGDGAELAVAPGAFAGLHVGRGILEGVREGEVRRKKGKETEVWLKYT